MMKKQKIIKHHTVVYIAESVKREKKQRKEHYINGDTSVFIADPLPENISIEHVITTIKHIVPSYMLSHVDYLQIGEIEEFAKRNINALYKDGVIYVTNVQDNEEDMLDDIIHELAHCLEDVYSREIYADDLIENEFQQKRAHLYYILKAYGYPVSAKHCLNVDYFKDFDDFLYKVVGYPVLDSLMGNLFVNPYSITSLREYFAEGINKYYLGNRKKLQSICPHLYLKIEELNNKEEENGF